MIIGEFVDVYPPSLDGVGRVCYSYCETLNQMGHTTYYIAPYSNCDFQPAVPTILSTSIGFLHEAYHIGLPFLDSSYHKKLDEIPFDIVHTHSPFLAGNEAMRIARSRKIPLVTTFHSKYYDDALAKTHSKALAKVVTQKIVHFYDQCDAVWTVNHATAQVLKEYGYHGQILVLENGTNPEELSQSALEEIHRRVPFQSGVSTLLFVGQHNYKKNLHGVLKACALLKADGQPFHLVTAGIGPDFKAIVNEAKILGLEKETTFLGFVGDRSLLMALYHESDLLVFPSLYDNAPMVLREAAVMGTPGLVVAGSCAAEGVTDAVNGFISPDETGEAIEETILRALPNLETVGKKAHETIPVPWSGIMKQVLAEYERLIDEKKKSSC